MRLTYRRIPDHLHAVTPRGFNSFWDLQKCSDVPMFLSQNLTLYVCSHRKQLPSLLNAHIPAPNDRGEDGHPDGNIPM